MESICGNCGKAGHLFHLCKMPITSIGIIAFRITPENIIEYLMVCRKDSLGYVDFLRGKFSLYQKQYIMNMIKQMTNSEKKILLKRSETVMDKPNIEKEDRVVALMKGINWNGSFYNLKSLIEESKTDWKEPEWGFPKGRRNTGETDFDCALREFSEETGYSKTILHNINNIVPIEEVFTGSNHNSYRHKYYVMYIHYSESLLPRHDFQRTEISNIRWHTTPQCLDVIRPYNLEKKRVILNLSKCFKNTHLIRI